MVDLRIGPVYHRPIDVVPAEADSADLPPALVPVPRLQDGRPARYPGDHGAQYELYPRHLCAERCARGALGAARGGDAVAAG